MNHNHQNNNSIAVKPYSLTDMCRIYSVCHRTMQKWILPFEAELGEKQGRYYSIRQVKIIFEKLGLPTFIKTD